MNWREEYKKLLWITALFMAIYFLPTGHERFDNAIKEALILIKWYAQKHVLLCLVPAFFIAGVISVFFSKDAVIRYLGPKAKKWIAYGVASVSGTILAVCSCTVLPLFSGIYKRGAGLGPAIAFLYSGPAINILAIILTARILGAEIGIARVVGAIMFSVIIGFFMHMIFRKEEKKKAEAQLAMSEQNESRPFWQTAIHFFILVAILIFANWGRPTTDNGLWHTIYYARWTITAVFGILFACSLIVFLKIDWKWIVSASALVFLTAILVKSSIVTFSIAVVLTAVLISREGGEPGEWMSATWDFAKQILPLLALGVLIAGFLLGSPEGAQGMIPSDCISKLVGGNSIFSNFFASIAGAFMYFATLTEVPILQGLIANGMGKGPALALLLAGPALSLPNMLVIRSVIGTRKTVVFVSLVVVMASLTGFIFGRLF